MNRWIVIAVSDTYGEVGYCEVIAITTTKEEAHQAAVKHNSGAKLYINSTQGTENEYCGVDFAYYLREITIPDQRVG